LGSRREWRSWPTGQAAQRLTRRLTPTNLFEVRQIRTRWFLVQAQAEFRHDCQQMIEYVRLNVFVLGSEFTLAETHRCYATRRAACAAPDVPGSVPNSANCQRLHQ